MRTDTTHVNVRYPALTCNSSILYVPVLFMKGISLRFLGVKWYVVTVCMP